MGVVVLEDKFCEDGRGVLIAEAAQVTQGTETTYPRDPHLLTYLRNLPLPSRQCVVPMHKPNRFPYMRQPSHTSSSWVRVSSGTPCP